MFQSDKARFRLEMTINQLSNIPQLSGKCGLELRIGDRRGFSLARSKTAVSTDLNADGPSTTISSSSLGSGVSVSTGLRKIHNFKCAFNCKVECNLKFPVKKSENLIGSKFAYFTVYTKSTLASGSSSKHQQLLLLLLLLCAPHHSHLHYDTLGKVDINLSEYLNFTEPRTSKYLLRDSKVNSVLSVTVSLKEIPPDAEFHTNLQVEDLSHQGTNGSTPTASTVHSSTNTTVGAKKSLASPTFNVPVFERKNVFSGFNEVLAGDGHSNHSGGNGTNHSDRSGSATPHGNGKHASGNGSTTPSGGASASGLTGLGVDQSQQQPLLMDTLVNKLYQRVLESTWDPELHTLLSYPPEQCIYDIFENPDNRDGWNQKLSKQFGMVSGADEDDDDDAYRNLNGLINEVSYRGDLKSWG